YKEHVSAKETEVANFPSYNRLGLISMRTKTSGIEPHLLQQFALIGKALSSPSRLQILDLLCQAERTVETLAKESSLTVANTSQHLQILRQAGMVVSRREKNFVVYQIAGEDISGLWKMVQTVGGKQLTEINKTLTTYFNKKYEMEALEYAEIVRKASEGEILLLDVRPEDEFNHTHVKGATSIPLQQLKKRFNELPQDKIIVAYCRGPYCVLSEEAVRYLRKKGLNAYRLPEGVGTR
ncbi:MAG: ArsR/SmtB family transcription factor, partial [Chitinispirillaceae bacterium]